MKGLPYINLHDLFEFLREPFKPINPNKPNINYIILFIQYLLINIDNEECLKSPYLKAEIYYHDMNSKIDIYLLTFFLIQLLEKPDTIQIDQLINFIKFMGEKIVKLNFIEIIFLFIIELNNLHFIYNILYIFEQYKWCKYFLISFKINTKNIKKLHLLNDMYAPLSLSNITSNTKVLLLLDLFKDLYRLCNLSEIRLIFLIAVYRSINKRYYFGSLNG